MGKKNKKQKETTPVTADVKKEELKEDVPASPEMVVINKKLDEIRKDHTELTNKKKELIQQVRKVDEDGVKLIGAYQKLMEVKNELIPVDKIIEKVEKDTARRKAEAEQEASECTHAECECEEEKETETEGHAGQDPEVKNETSPEESTEETEEAEAK